MLSFSTLEQANQQISDSFKHYLRKIEKKASTLKSASTTSVTECKENFQLFTSEPNLLNLIFFVKTLISNGVWVSHSYLRLLISFTFLTNISKSKRDVIPAEDRKHYLKLVKEGALPENVPDETIFKVIYDALEKFHHNPGTTLPFSIKAPPCTIALTSGVFNEIFSTAAFERAAKYLEVSYGIKYIVLETSGSKSTPHNAKLIKKQLADYVQSYPEEKLWIISFSKGGNDCLHFLKKNPEFSNNHIIGLSTIATPILGSPKASSAFVTRFIKNIARFNGMEDLDKNISSLFSELQESLKHSVRRGWFYRNHKYLPKRLFYSSLAMEAKWYESHIWMMLTKLFIQSGKKNDGVVDVDCAHFPDYFGGINLGILRGHHLVGSRSSFFSQEALIEAHLIFLQLKKLV